MTDNLYAPVEREDDCPIDSIEPHPENPNLGDDDVVEESIKEHGFYGWIVCQKSTRRILLGHTRWRVMRKLGAGQIPVEWLDVDDEEALRLLVMDNRSAELAQRDEGALETILMQLKENTALGLLGTGYTVTAFDDLRKKLHPPALADLANQVGPPRPQDAWERVVLVIPPELATDLRNALDEIGEDDLSRARFIIDKVGQSA